MDTEFKIKNTVIETVRLILRAWKDTDLLDLYEYAKVEGVGESAGWTRHTTIEDSKKALNGYISGDNVFAIVYKETNKVIGSVGVGKVSADGEYKDYIQKGIGYVLSRDYWGKGLMTEAVKAVVDWLFHNTDIEILSCGFFEGNDRSRRVIEKCGFKFVSAETFNQNDEILRGRSYSLIKSEYLSKQYLIQRIL